MTRLPTAETPAHEAGEHGERDQQRRRGCHWSRGQQIARRGADGRPAARPAPRPRRPARPSPASCGRSATRRLTGGLPHAPRDQPLGDADEVTSSAASTRADDQRRPDLDRLAVIGAGEQLRADAGDGAGRQLADDGADQAGGDRDLHRGEQERQRGRPAQLPERLRRRGAVGAHQVEMDRIGRAQALHHADRDREEGEIGRDQRLGDEAAESVGSCIWPVKRLKATTTRSARWRGSGSSARRSPTASGCGRGSAHGRCRRRAGCRAACRRRSRRSVEESVTQAW